MLILKVHKLRFNLKTFTLLVDDVLKEVSFLNKYPVLLWYPGMLKWTKMCTHDAFTLYVCTLSLIKKYPSSFSFLPYCSAPFKVPPKWTFSYLFCFIYSLSIIQTVLYTLSTLSMGSTHQPTSTNTKLNPMTMEHKLHTKYKTAQWKLCFLEHILI